jgi:hypothetical protein
MERPMGGERWRTIMACLLDHYLSEYEQNDGQKLEGRRDAISTEAEQLVPNWRELRDDWSPLRKPEFK